MDPEETPERLDRAMIWRDAARLGERVEVYARHLKEARRLPEEKYGGGNVFDLPSREDAEKPRRK
jgi:hypothetical protein